jgi:hypothetical protein
VAAKLAIIAFCFAIMPCEYSTTPMPGKTKMVTISHVIFHDIHKWIVSHDSEVANIEYVTVTFVDQKNGHKNDACTQQKKGGQVICHVWCLHALVDWIHQTMQATPATIVNTILLASKLMLITSTLLLQKL